MPKSRDDSGELVITSESIIFIFKSIGKVCVIGRLVNVSTGFAHLLQKLLESNSRDHSGGRQGRT